MALFVFSKAHGVCDLIGFNQTVFALVSPVHGPNCKGTSFFTNEGPPTLLRVPGILLLRPYFF